MPYPVVLSEGFLGKPTYWETEEWKFFDTPEGFFEAVENLKGKTLLFFITFEAGYPFLSLPPREGALPPFGLAVLEEKKEFPRLRRGFKTSFKKSSLTKGEYLKDFERIKRYIEGGDIYQVNYTVRFDFDFEGEPFALWESFLKTQPVPYGVYFETPLFTLIGGSMELFLHKEGEKLTSKPIKGTLPVTENPERFKELEKELAENLMITDMVRNDLGRVARVGSVKVSSLFEVESYKTLHQLVSTVECKTDATFEEIIRATFPPASVSGAPKRRAVEIIAEIEPHAREIYCGTVGVIKPNGNFVANVSIRTAILRENTLSYYAGGGIVYDSDPEREWREVNLKAEAFLKTLEVKT